MKKGRTEVEAPEARATRGGRKRPGGAAGESGRKSQSVRRSSLVTPAPGPAPPPRAEVLEDDEVARRLVMRRELWDRIVEIAAAVNAQDGTDRLPSQVAAELLERAVDAWPDTPRRS